MGSTVLKTSWVVLTETVTALRLHKVHLFFNTHNSVLCGTPESQLDTACSVVRDRDVGECSVRWVLCQCVESVVCHVAVSVDLIGR